MSEIKTVMVLGGTKWQIPLISRLKKEGHRTIAVNPNLDSPAFAYADGYSLLDILNRKECLAYAQHIKADAIMSDECDIAVPTVAFVADEMKLPSIGGACARLYTDKYEMRMFGERNGFPTPAFCKCKKMQEAIDFFKRLNDKMILKPLDANSSRGVYTIKSEEDLQKYFDKSLSFSKIEKAVLCERYIKGPEFTIDGVKTAAGHFSLAVSEKRHYAGNENIACSLYFSHDNEKYDYAELRRVNDQYIQLSGLPFGLTHAEYKYENGKFYLIEIAARGGGNLISSHIVPRISGIDTYKYLIDKSLGILTSEQVMISSDFSSKCAVLQFFNTTERNGRVKNINGINFLKETSEIIAYDINYKKGDRIEELDSDSKRPGYYIACCESKEKLKKVISDAEKFVKIEVEADDNGRQNY